MGLSDIIRAIVKHQLQLTNSGNDWIDFSLGDVDCRITQVGERGLFFVRSKLILPVWSVSEMAEFVYRNQLAGKALEGRAVIGDVPLELLEMATL